MALWIASWGKLSSGWIRKRPHSGSTAVTLMGWEIRRLFTKTSRKFQQPGEFSLSQLERFGGPLA